MVAEDRAGAGVCSRDRSRELWAFDRQFLKAGKEWIIGVDEAGRGCLAGPIVAGAVVFQSPIGLEGVDDSKRLSAEGREVLAAEVRRVAVAWGLGWVSEREIDRRGIDWANRIAFTRALRELQRRFVQLARENTLALIDGIRPALRSPFQQELLKGGDSKSLSIAAASILAKTARDRYCIEVLDKKFPAYGFARHKGYATREHRRALMQYGPARCHRQSFTWQSEPEEEHEPARGLA